MLLSLAAHRLRERSFYSQPLKGYSNKRYKISTKNKGHIKQKSCYLLFEKKDAKGEEQYAQLLVSRRDTASIKKRRSFSTKRKA